MSYSRLGHLAIRDPLRRLVRLIPKEETDQHPPTTVALPTLECLTPTLVPVPIERMERDKPWATTPWLSRVGGSQRRKTPR